MKKQTKYTYDTDVVTYTIALIKSINSSNFIRKMSSTIDSISIVGYSDIPNFSIFFEDVTTVTHSQTIDFIDVKTVVGAVMIDGKIIIGEYALSNFENLVFALLDYGRKLKNPKVCNATLNYVPFKYR